MGWQQATVSVHLAGARRPNLEFLQAIRLEAGIETADRIALILGYPEPDLEAAR